MIFIHAMLALCMSAAAYSSQSDPCYDISKGQPASLSGLLIYKILPGSPGFNDVAKGDDPEPTFLLQLDEEICITGDPDIEEPQLRFSSVHLFPDRYEKTLKNLVNQRVNVDLTNQFPGFNGHHHAPLVALVKNINTESCNDPAKSAQVKLLI